MKGHEATLSWLDETYMELSRLCAGKHNNPKHKAWAAMHNYVFVGPSQSPGPQANWEYVV